MGLSASALAETQSTEGEAKQIAEIQVAGFEKATQLIKNFLADEDVQQKGGIDSDDMDSQISYYSSENERISLERAELSEDGANMSTAQRKRDEQLATEYSGNRYALDFLITIKPEA